VNAIAIKFATTLAFGALCVACSMTPPGPSQTHSSLIEPPRQDPVSSVVTASGGVASEQSARLASALETAVDSLAAPGAQAAIVFADGSLWTGGAGLAADGLPMRPDHLLAIGSITKAYTAALVLKLADEGILTLDDPVAAWVPDDPHGAGVSLRQLLTHTAGLASDDVSLARVCAPGTCYSYSNGGFGLLGQVIESAVGRSYAQSLRDRILRPLNLLDTFYTTEEIADGESATGFQAGDARNADTLFRAGDGPGWRAASGGLIATAADTAGFMHALMAGSILAPATLEQMLDLEASRGLPGTNECEPGTAMSIALRSTPNGDAWYHGGFVGYFRSWAEHFPDRDVSVAVIVNSDAPVTPIVDALEAVVFGEAAGPPPSRPGACNSDIELRTAGGETRRLTSDPGFDGFPSLSAVGDRVAWIANRSGANDLFVAAADGSGAINLTNDAAQDLFPRWSPDGSAIAYSANVDGDQEIYLIAPDGTNRRQLTNNGANDIGPAWSPDGAWLAYSTGSPTDIHVMRADGTADRVLVGEPGNEWWPAWSPDGKQIVFESGGALFVVPAEGGAPTRIPIQQVRVTMFPAWAPGKAILFSSDAELYSVASDGSGLKRVTQTSTAEESMAWGPDGSIVYQVSRWETP
jgi:D-alanyl-D-alanine carboxypeptidase